MKQMDSRQLAHLFRDQHGLASRAQLRSHGVTSTVERNRIARGEWERVTPRVVRLTGSPVTDHQRLMVALLAAGPTAVASHRSAAWLWGLVPAPADQSVTVPYAVGAPRGPFVVHRLKGRPPQPVLRSGVAVTNPLRTLVDLAALAGSQELDDAVDRAVALRLVSVEGIRAELDRIGGKGRRGVGAMRRSLDRRGLSEGPQPSVLEARLHRLLRAAGIVPLATEVVAGPDGRYRLDVSLDPGVAVEVDGHRYHSTPEQKSYDERRRARLRLDGLFVLVFDWRDVTFDARRVAVECRQALARHGTAVGRRLAQ